MTAEELVALIEEMVDLKVQQYAELHLKLPPDLARLARNKRQTDLQRIIEIRQLLVAALSGNG
jgi:hypothetical protein